MRKSQKRQYIRSIFVWIVWLVFLMTATHFIDSPFLQTLAVIATTLHAWRGCRWLINAEKDTTS
jgi:hypothetical protein